MGKVGTIIVVSQHYPPDQSTTSAIMAEIASHLAAEHAVLVLSGTPGFRPADTPWSRPTVVQVKNRIPAKAALIRRAMAELLFTFRVFVMLLRKARRGDAVLTVTAPFMLPYAVAVAAKLKGARSALIMHDLFPDVLVITGLLKPRSPLTRAIRIANELIFHLLDRVIIIGRDTEPLLLRYRSLTRGKIRFIPNWATLDPEVRSVEPNNPYRPHAAAFVVGLCGNLGFTHDSRVVFEAARLLREETGIHFLLSGWGIGFERLKQLQSDANLPNVTLVERVLEKDLEQFLAAGNVWLIPYRKNAAGVSVPSRLYNLLAVGRPVIVVSEPNAEAARTVAEDNLGWIVTPDHPKELADAIRAASEAADGEMTERAAAAARSFSLRRAMADYADLMEELLKSSAV